MMQHTAWQDNLVALLLGTMLIYGAFWLSWRYRRIYKSVTAVEHPFFDETIEPISCMVTMLVAFLIFLASFIVFFYVIALGLVLLASIIPIIVLAFAQSHLRRIPFISAIFGMSFQFIFCAIIVLLAMVARITFYEPVFTESRPSSIAYGYYFCGCICCFVGLSLWFPWREKMQLGEVVVTDSPSKEPDKGSTMP